MTSPRSGDGGMERCPQCSAAVPAGAPWCGLCWTDLRPAPPPAPAAPAGEAPAGWSGSGGAPSAPVAQPPGPAAVPGQPGWGAPRAAAVDPLTAPLHEVAASSAPGNGATPAWPCTRCGASNPFEADTCRTCGSPFLAAAQTPPPAGRLLAMSRKERFLWAGAVVVVFCALTALLAAVA